MDTNNYKLKEPDNDWANDVKDNPIHISQAESGLKGYYCMGCTKPMQAVKMKNPKHQSYFRHHIKDLDTNKIECVHASKEYREKLAYNYFMRVKQIKVPAVYKFPPQGEQGNAMLLDDATTIIAYRVAKELTFYENEEGEIKWGKNPEIEERYLLIRPDAVFFDENDKPILFLEFVVTHKPDVEKLIKLKRLGINTVQIIVPKLPEFELEKSISSVSKVKWTYSEIESNTDYIRSTNGHPAGVPHIDEEQRKLFEESFKCRSAQIGNLIRSIKRCLGSQSYHRAEHLFEREISRIENATREHRARLDEIQARIKSEVNAELGDRILAIGQQREKFQSNKADLETRYLTKREKLTREQENLDREVQFRYGIRESESSIRDRFRTAEERLGNDFERELSTIGRAIKREISAFNNYKRSEERIRNDIEKDAAFERDFGKAKRGIVKEFKKQEDRERQEFDRTAEILQAEIDSLNDTAENDDESLRRRSEREKELIAKRISERDVLGGDELSERIANVLQVRGHLDGYQRDITRIEEAKRIIQDGAYKKWD